MTIIKDYHNNVAVKRLISPIAIGTTGTGQTSRSIDTNGFSGVEILVHYAGATATNAVYTASVLEGDVTGTMTPVAAGDLIGSAGLGVQAGARTSGVGKFYVKRVGYIGQKRYIGLKLSSTITAGTLVSAELLLARPQNAPVAT